MYNLSSLLTQQDNELKARYIKELCNESCLDVSEVVIQHCDLRKMFYVHIFHHSGYVHTIQDYSSYLLMCKVGRYADPWLQYKEA